ncbi:thioredoxin-like protein [Absidia repens]|uniref:Thioredoxin-like protein n=1 Tax=Absidia repens TaxID=90262 RepID=A0A1X2IB93_9FUNG|nr:thioredoxin-like protein [Absidia repens]
MKQLSLLWFTLFCFISQYVSSKSIEMDKAAFDSLTASGIWFVEHFSPYCPLCIDFAPTWKELAEEEDGLASTHNIHFGTINCSIYGDLCAEHDITGYPKMKLYVNGIYKQTYLGTRSKRSIKAYLLHGHQKWAKMISPHDQKAAATTKATAAIQTSTQFTGSDTDSMLAFTGSTPKHIIDSPLESEVLQFNAITTQELLDNQRILILGAYGNGNELFRSQFKKLAAKTNGAAVLIEMDVDTNSAIAQDIYNLPKLKVPTIIIINGKNKHYYDRDIYSNLLDIQQPQFILQTLHDIISGNLEGTSTERLEQHSENEYGPFQWHGNFILVAFAFLVAAMYKTISRRKAALTNSNQSYTNSSSKLV